MELKDVKNDELKAALRRDMASRRMAHDPAVAGRRARLAQEFILLSHAWRAAASIGLYMPVNGETGTSLLLDVGLATGKGVYLPKITGAGAMDFFPCTTPGELRPGPMGILEPSNRGAPAVRLDFLVMPGLAFDMHGARLGYGGGYYDRFLRGHPDFCPLTLGLCFSFQIVSSLPVMDQDIPVRGICSEEWLHWL